MNTQSKFLLLTCGIGILFATANVLPNILQRTDTDIAFRGIEMMGTDMEHHYVARMKEVADGNGSLGNVFYSEPKDQPFLQPPLPEWTVATIGTLFGFDIVTVSLLSKVLFGIALVCVFTLFFSMVTRRPLESLLAVSALLFAGAMIGSPWDFFDWVLNTRTSYPFLRFSRPINPQWSSLWFFVVLCFTASWIQHRKTWKLVAAGVCTALLLYSYLYAWTLLGAFYALLLFWYAWQKDLQRCKDLLLLAAVFVILGMPYFLHLWETTQHPWYTETSHRFGIVPRRDPIFGVWILVFVFLSVFSRKWWPETWPIVPALSFAGLFALNQHVFTGVFVVPHHYHWYFNQPLASIFAILVVLYYLRKYLSTRPYIWNALLSCGFLLVISFGFLQQTRAYTTSREGWGRRQSYAPILSYINNNIEPEKVVGVSDRSYLQGLIPVYTSANTYSEIRGNYYLTPDDRARATTFFHFWLDGVTPEEARDTFPTEHRKTVSRIYLIYYRELLGTYEAIPDDVVQQEIEQYEEYYALSVEEKLSLYPLHYLVVTPSDEKTQQLRSLTAKGREVYNEEGYSIISFVE